MAILLDELTQITSTLEENGIEYAICGGLSLAIHGFVRATVDIDILIRPESLERSLQLVSEKGFDIRGLDT